MPSPPANNGWPHWSTRATTRWVPLPISASPSSADCSSRKLRAFRCAMTTTASSARSAVAPALSWQNAPCSRSGRRTTSCRPKAGPQARRPGLFRVVEGRQTAPTPKHGEWGPTAFVQAGQKCVCYDHRSGVRVITSDGLLSVTYVPAKFRVIDAPHPVVTERATDTQAAMVLRAFGVEHYIEDNADVRGATRMFWAPGWPS